MNLFKCPCCGYRNYMTRDDLDRESRDADKAMRTIEWEIRHPRRATIRRVFRNFVLAVFWWPRCPPVGKEHEND